VNAVKLHLQAANMLEPSQSERLEALRQKVIDSKKFVEDELKKIEGRQSQEMPS
jgi:hypothetical protein